MSDSSGIPQIGAQVQLLRPDLSVIASVYTDVKGHYSISSIPPGRYAVKAMGAWFLPALREDLRIRTNTVVNLTLNTLYEAIRWLPAEPRTGNAQSDDWKWTLRSAANRPLLRWLEDGPLVVATDGTGSHPKLKARLMATGQEGAFSESGERITAAVQKTPTNSSELLASVDFDPHTAGGIESMLGFEQELGLAGSVQSVAAVALHPEIASDGSEGVDEAAVRGSETIHLGDEFEVEAGSSGVVVWRGGPESETTANLLPFASLEWKNGKEGLRYGMTTFLPALPNADQNEAQAWLPAISARGGSLTVEHGLHQEIRWQRSTDSSTVSALLFNDRIDNPAIEAMSRQALGDLALTAALLDTNSGLLHAAGPNFSAAGLTAAFEHKLPAGNHLSLGYANGNALVLPAASDSETPPMTLAQLLANLHPHRTQSYSISLSGTLEGTNTRWQASYSWQPEDTMTPVAPFAAPYLNLHLRQPVRLHLNGSALSFQAILDLRNLLAQGYQPYLLSDGSLLIFAREQRSFRAGLAFNF